MQDDVQSKIAAILSSQGFAAGPDEPTPEAKAAAIATAVESVGALPTAAIIQLVQLLLPSIIKDAKWVAIVQNVIAAILPAFQS